MILQMMMQAAQQGMSPQQFFQQNAGNPAVAQIAKIAQGKSREQLMETASNMASQRGTNLDAIARQMGIPYKG
ncbi:MAG: hypothetical protein IKK57_10890 [Clostridia bacterium]|nr:hypothetical protein [Clostridia bacterium]